MGEYSVAEARRKLSLILREAETQGAVTITRRGRPVAVVLSFEEYARLRGQRGFWAAYQRLREEIDKVREEIPPDLFEDVRDRTPGRKVAL